MIDAKLIKDNIPEIKDEQVQPLVELVNNTFKKELEDKETKGFGEGRKQAYDTIDAVVAKHGYSRGEGLTSEHYENVLVTLKEQKMDDKTKIKLKNQDKTILDLEKQINEKHPDFEKKENDYKNQIEVLKSTMEDKEQVYGEEKTNHKKDLIKLQLIAGMPKIKEGIGEKTKELHTTQTINDLLKIADFNDDGTVIFRDKDGKVLYNAANKNNPFTIGEMFKENDNFKDIVDEGRQVKGIGSDKKLKQTQSFAATIVGAKNQVEADDIIRDSLNAQGIDIRHPEYQKKFTEIRKENKVTELPLM